MNHDRPSLLATLIAVSVLAFGCSDESTTVGSTPDIQSRELSQLSAGGGIAGYDFYIDINGLPTRVGTLIVTNGAYDQGQGYYDQMEYWRWEPGSLADIESGTITQIDVDFVNTSATYDPTLVANFESGTGQWTAWDVNRLFDLSSTPSLEWNNPGAGEILYTMEADAWAGATSGPNPLQTITYYLKLDFSNPYNDYPEMYWYISLADYTAWTESEQYDEDSDGIYEVRLTDDSVMTQTTVGLGYELKTVK